MFNSSDYIETVETNGLTVGVSYDEFAYNDCPLDWAHGHVACLPLDVDECERTDLERLGDAEQAVDNARYYCEDDPDAGALKAFTTHYTRKGWAVEVCNLTGEFPGEYKTVALAVEQGYGTPDMLRRELEDWAFGNVFQLDFYAPYAHEVNGETVTELQRFSSVSGVYFSDYVGSDAIVKECEEYAVDALTDVPQTLESSVTVTTVGRLAA